MKKPRWNRCVVEDKKYLCKASYSKQNCVHARFGPVIHHLPCYKEWNGIDYCCNIIAQKEALISLIDKCERDAKWAGFQLSALE
jgi:hypothetical protein